MIVIPVALWCDCPRRRRQSTANSPVDCEDSRVLEMILVILDTRMVTRINSYPNYALPGLTRPPACHIIRIGVPHQPPVNIHTVLYYFLEATMRNSIHSPGVLCMILASLVVSFTGVSYADGTETLGPPTGVSLAVGTGIVAAGVGLANGGGPYVIDLATPAGAIIKQVFVYWEGQTPYGGPADVDFKINGVDINGSDPGDLSAGGDRIGEPLYFFTTADGYDIYALAYRLDITDKNLVAPGPNSLTVTELDGFGFVTDGAGVLVIYEDPSAPAATIGLRDGIDLAFIGFAGVRQVTVLQTFTFPAASAPRVATLSMFFSSVQGPVSGSGIPRPTSIEVTVAGTTTTYSNILGSNDGNEWDSQNLLIDIPAGATSLSVQAFSRDDAGTLRPARMRRYAGLSLMDPELPASLFWLAAGLSVPFEPPPGGQGCTPGYWKQPHHFGNWPDPYTPRTLFSDVFEDAFPGKTLVGVLGQGGGGLYALGRHLVAALLNAASDHVAFELTPGYIVGQFNDVFPGSRHDYNALKDILESYNERHCPLGRAEEGESIWKQNPEGIADDVALLQNFPNPFNPVTQIGFLLPEASTVTLKIFNTLGEEVRTLVSAQLGAGVHTYTWNARDNNGQPVTSGVYIYTLKTGTVTQVKKMSLLR